MLEMTMTNGNIDTVARALEGITGVAKVVAAQDGPDRYVVVARMSRELDTVDSLRRRNIQAYWPSYEKLVVTRKQGGRAVRRMQRIGMIPGYVFSPLDPKLDFEQLLGNIVGAIDIVRTFSGNPWLIPDRYIRDIRRIEVGLNTPRPDGGGAVLHTFKLRQRVRFVDDLLGDWPPGRIVKLAQDGRISVEVDVMGRKVPVMVLPHQIERT